MIFFRLYRCAIPLICLVSALASPGLADELPLGPGEVVKIVVYGREDLSAETALDEVGFVLVPLLGRIDAGGAIPMQLEDRIRSGLVAKGLVEKPDVSVEVVRRRDVFVSGDVQNPSAQIWRPGLTVEQAVTLAGGMRAIKPDEFGTLLQAYGAIERFQALELAIGGLAAKQARLEAEIDFANLVFDPEAALGPVAADRLNVMELMPPDAAKLTDAERLPLVATTLAAYDIAQFRQLQIRSHDLKLITFSDAISANTQLLAVRSTEQALVEDRIAINLAAFNSLKLQRVTLAKKSETLAEQKDLIAQTVIPLREQLDNTLTFKQTGLARSADVVSLQTAYATLLSTQLSQLTDIADTDLSIQQKDLEIQNFAASLRHDLSLELEAVVAVLGESEGRLTEARRAANIAEGYRGASSASAILPRVRYDIRQARSEGAGLREVQADSIVMPGDMIVVSVVEQF